MENKKKEIRKFGLIAFCFFGILLGVSVFKKKMILQYLFGAFSCMGLLLLALPIQFKWLYTGWVKIGHFIGRIINAFLMIAAYYLVMTPSGLLKKIISGTPLILKFEKDRDSYWVEREEPLQAKDRFEKRY